jgi:DUF4097 and DUF4098 domain-containing protein YvlB
MASYPPPYPPPPPPGFDPRDQRRYMRQQMKAAARAQRDAFRAQREQMRYQMRGMRRGSVLGPVILIGIGVVVLLVQSGRIDHMRFWGWYAHWWPLLMVLAGCVMLAEWAIDQYLLRNPEHPQYRRSIGPGVVFLLILVAFGGLIANHTMGYPSGYSRWFPGSHFDQDSFDQFFGDKHESDDTLDLAYTQGTTLEVVNPRGSVSVNGTSDDNKIHIALHKQVYSRSDSEAEAKADHFRPESHLSDSVWRVSMPSMQGASADLIITVPAAAGVTINANRGDVHVASIKAPVTVIANHGDIELAAISGATTAHLNSGGSSIAARNMDGGVAVQGHAEDVTLIEVTGPVNIQGEFFGTTHLEHINGPVHFHTSRTDFQLARLDGEVEMSSDANLAADQVLGPVVLNTHGRNIHLDRVAGDISVGNQHGTVDITAAPTIGNINVENRGGSVKVTMPEHASFTVQAETTDGDTFNEFSLPSNSSGNRHSISGMVGNGGVAVHVTTTNSDVSILKADVPPIPLTPPAPPKITLTPPPAPNAPAAPKAPKAPKAPPAPPAPPQ